MSDENGEYRPVACETYSQYELYILHRQRLQMRWRDAGGVEHIGRVRPVDLQTRQGEEFMIAIDARGKWLEVRLDRIVLFRPIEV